MKVVAVVLLYGAFFVAVEVLSKRFHLRKEHSRKLVHIVAGAIAACLPLFLSFGEIICLGILFIPVMLVSKWRNIFGSIHGVERHTYGEVYFPAAILLTALLFPHAAPYVYGLLVMGLADGFASVIGQHYGRRTFRLGKAQKSYAGSATFFVITLAAGVFALHMAGANAPQAALFSTILALVLTPVEAALIHGLDNLVLPPAAALLLTVVMSRIN